MGRFVDGMRITSWVLFVLILCLGLAIFVLVFVHALKRTFFQNTDPYFETRHHITTKHKIVDLFVPDRDALRQLLSCQTVRPGMTALIDQGAMSLDTGIYMLQANNTWTQIEEPEIGNVFTILKGKYANKQHTIRASFAHEVRPPTETQILSNENPYQTLKESTSTIHVCETVRTTVKIAMNNTESKTSHDSNNASSVGRTLRVINTSPTFSCQLTCEPYGKDIQVAPNKVIDIQLQLKKHDNCFYYSVVAQS